MSEETNRTCILSHINISINDLWTSLDPSKAPEIDNFNPKVLKYTVLHL